MTVEELIERYERQRRHAEAVESRVPEARLLEVVLEDLRELDGVEAGPRWFTTEEAADRLGLAPKTVADWCRRSRDPEDPFDKLPNARKTSEGGEWRIPASDLETARGPDEQLDDRDDEIPSLI